MMVDLVCQAGFANLIQSLETIKINGVAIRHDQAMKGNRQPPLAEGVNLLGFPQELAACGNKQVLAVLGVHIVTQHGDHRAAEIAIETSDEHTLEQRTLKNGIALSDGQIEVG